MLQNNVSRTIERPEYHPATIRTNQFDDFSVVSSFMRYDPAQDLKKLKCPVLALNGEKDIQVDAAMNLAAIQERITGNGNKM